MPFGRQLEHPVGTVPARKVPVVARRNSMAPSYCESAGDEHLPWWRCRGWFGGLVEHQKKFWRIVEHSSAITRRAFPRRPESTRHFFSFSTTSSPEKTEKQPSSERSEALGRRRGMNPPVIETTVRLAVEHLPWRAARSSPIFTLPPTANRAVVGRGRAPPPASAAWDFAGAVDDP